MSTISAACVAFGSGAGRRDSRNRSTVGTSTGSGRSSPKTSAAFTTVSVMDATDLPRNGRKQPGRNATPNTPPTPWSTWTWWPLTTPFT
jgi:hypothetical protein